MVVREDTENSTVSLTLLLKFTQVIFVMMIELKMIDKHSHVKAKTPPPIHTHIPLLPFPDVNLSSSLLSIEQRLSSVCHRGRQSALPDLRPRLEIMTPLQKTLLYYLSAIYDADPKPMPLNTGTCCKQTCKPRPFITCKLCGPLKAPYLCLHQLTSASV